MAVMLGGAVAQHIDPVRARRVQRQPVGIAVHCDAFQASPCWCWLEHGERLAAGKAVMIGGIDHRAMGADPVQLARRLQAVEINGQQARIGLAAAGDIEAAAFTVGDDIVEAAFAADRDGSGRM